MARSAQNGTLTASTVATVTVSDAFPGINIVNRSQTGTIWVTLDGSTPTVAGANCYPVLGVRYFNVAGPHATAVTVKLISSSALDYTVEGDPGGSS